MKKNLRFAAIITAFGIALAFAGCKNASEDNSAAMMAMMAVLSSTNTNGNGSSNPFTGTVWGLVANGTLQTSAEMDFSFTSSTKVTYFGREYTYTVENGRIAHISNGSVGDFEISSLDPSSATFSVTGSAQKVNYKKRTGPVNGGQTEPKPASDGSWQIKVASGIANGDVETNLLGAKPGAEVVITVYPSNGYKLGQLTVTAYDGSTVSTSPWGSSGKQFAFTMPNQIVTVNATFVLDSATGSGTGTGGGGSSAASGNPFVGTTWGPWNTYSNEFIESIAYISFTSNSIVSYCGSNNYKYTVLDARTARITISATGQHFGDFKIDSSDSSRATLFSNPSYGGNVPYKKR